MNIVYKDYIMRPSEHAHEKFDLYKKGILGEKSKNAGKAKETTLGYGMSLPNCINQIVHEYMNEKDGTVDFNTWLSEYKKEYEEIKKVFHP